MTHTEDKSLIEARKAVRVCLDSAGLSTDRSLWLAELVLYHEAEEWWPLLGRYRLESGHISTYFDILDDTRKPGFYDDFVKASVRFNSIASSVTTDFNKFKGTGAILIGAPFPADGGLLEAIKGDLERLPRVLVIRTGEQSESYRREMIVPKWLKLAGPPETKERIYPDSPLVVGVPIRRSSAGAPLLLGIANFIVEIPDCETKAFAQQLYARLLAFSESASWMLTLHWGDVLDGFIPSHVPQIGIAHPALTKRRHFETVQLKDSGHDHPEKVNPGPEGDPLLFRAFKRSTGAASAGLELGGVKPAFLYRVAPVVETSGAWAGFKGHSESLRESAHGWLKSLYAHAPSRAHELVRPGTTHALREEHLLWLSAIVSGVVSEPPVANGDQPAPPTASLSELYKGGNSMPAVWPCQVLPALDLGAKKPLGFKWPVEPGVRFLLPWLDALSWLSHKEFKETGRSGTPSCKVWLLRGNPKDWSMEKEACSEPVHAWLNAARVEAKDAESRSGTLIELTYELDVRDMVRGWQRALRRPHVRGNDSGYLSRVLMLDCGGTIQQLGLEAETASELLAPLDGTSRVNFDLESSGDGLTVMLAWWWET